MTCLPSKTDIFFMETIFIGSYKTIEECYAVTFPKIGDFKSQIFSTDSLQKWYIYSI